MRHLRRLNTIPDEKSNHLNETNQMMKYNRVQKVLWNLMSTMFLVIFVFLFTVVGVEQNTGK